MATNFTIYPQCGESIDSLLRRMKRETEKLFTMADHCSHLSFIPRPEKRKQKSGRARARRRKNGSS